MTIRNCHIATYQRFTKFGTLLHSLENDKMLTEIANNTLKVGVVGLGYVGLPLAVEFGKKFDTVGFDVKKSRLDILCRA